MLATNDSVQRERLVELEQSMYKLYAGMWYTISTYWWKTDKVFLRLLHM